MQPLDKPQLAGFEEIEHTADWAYRVWAPNLEQLFIQAAQGLYSLVGVQLAASTRVVRDINLRGVDRESLLIAWLNELLYFHESENLGFDRLEILNLEANQIDARVTGATVEQWIKDIKAATYHNVTIRSTETGFEVTIVLDV